MNPAAAPSALPFFLGDGAAARFCLYHPPAGACRGAFVYLHPFAEEMNKARRMAALQARAFAAHGYAVLQLDLHGCGDSAGDFGDARWEGWLDDTARALRWLRDKLGDSLPQAPGLWGLRLGALLALDYAAKAQQISQQTPACLLLWQPVAQGASYLTQFLRLKVAAEMLAEGSASTAALRAGLAAGAPLEVAGYELAPAMADALETLDAARLAPPCPAHWFELASEAGRPLTPVAKRILQAWQDGGANAHGHVVAGPAFWASQEICEAPALLPATLAALEPACHAA